MVVSMFTLALLLVASAATAAPHILLMVLDDVGRADTGIYGPSNIDLPTLKSLAKDGVIFENFYTQTVCSPTRSSLLTGLYPFRFGMQHITTQIPGMIAGVPLDIPMLPALLADKGYERHMIGKWHCGYATWSHTPSRRGFQTYTGYLQAQGDYYKHNFAIDQLGGVLESIDGLDFWQNTRPMREAVGNYSLDIYRDAMLKVLRGYASRHDTPEKRAQHPLFVYLAHQTVHIPLQYRRPEPRCDSVKHAVRRIYCNMLVEMDDAIAEMVEEYKNLGMWDDLLILALTDNGGMVNFAQDKTHKDNPNFPLFPASQGSNYPLRGSKMTMYEGGVRSMAFAAGGKLPREARGRKLDVLAHVVDFSATVLAAAGVIPLRRESLALDGHNLYSLIMNKPGAMALRDHVPINIVLKGKRYSAVRFGKYKLIIDDFLNPAAQGWFDENGDLKEPAPQRTKANGIVSLYDLHDDPEERKDISADHPHLIQYGRDLIGMYVHGGKYLEPQESGRVRIASLPFLHAGVWKPWMNEADWTSLYQRNKFEQQKRLKQMELVMDDVLEDYSPEFTLVGEIPENFRFNKNDDEVEIASKLRQRRLFKA